MAVIKLKFLVYGSIEKYSIRPEILKFGFGITIETDLQFNNDFNDDFDGYVYNILLILLLYAVHCACGFELLSDGSTEALFNFISLRFGLLILLRGR